MALDAFKWTDPIMSQLNDLHSRWERNKNKSTGTALANFINTLIHEHREFREYVLTERIIKSMSGGELLLFYEQKEKFGQDGVLDLTISSKNLVMSCYTEHDIQNLSASITIFLSGQRGKQI